MESGGNGYLFSGDKKKRYYDFTLLFMVIALMLVGILMIASISPYNAAKYLGNSTFYTSRQIRYVIIGVAGMIGISLVDYRLYAMETPRRKWPILLLLAYVVIVALEVAVIAVGRTDSELSGATNGAARWLAIGPLKLQPGEFAKLFMIVIALEFTNMWVPQCIDKDEKNKIREYFSAMPFGKNTYVASKFAYIGIVTYVFFSFSMIWTITAGAFSIDPTAIGTADMTQGIAMVLFALSLFTSGFELCMFLVLGTKKAMMIKVGFFLALGIAVIGFLLFGKLLVFEKINWEAVMNWINTHQFEVVLIQILSSASGLLIYFGFYKLTCALYEP